MGIPELTEEQRIESFNKDRLSKVFGDYEILSFSRKELAKLCLKEIDYAIDLLDKIDETDFEDDNEE